MLDVFQGCVLGFADIVHLAQPDQGTGKLQEAQIAVRQLLEAQKDSPELFDCVAAYEVCIHHSDRLCS